MAARPRTCCCHASVSSLLSLPPPSTRAPRLVSLWPCLWWSLPVVPALCSPISRSPRPTLPVPASPGPFQPRITRVPTHLCPRHCAPEPLHTRIFLLQASGITSFFLHRKPDSVFKVLSSICPCLEVSLAAAFPPGSDPCPLSTLKPSSVPLDWLAYLFSWSSCPLGPTRGLDVEGKGCLCHCCPVEQGDARCAPSRGLWPLSAGDGTDCN